MNRKAAIFVIRGIKEQEPFETLDSFVKTFASAHSSAKKSWVQKVQNKLKFAPAGI